MTNKTKIVIAGIGGVGGFFGGLLAKSYAGNDNIEIYFIARGKHLEKIESNGLKVIKGDIEFVAKPHLATNDVDKIGAADYIIISTKNYDLAEMLNQLSPCVTANTVILPLLNGVEAVEKIRTQFPNNLVAAGCAYIVSAIKDPGIVENMGNRQEIYFGLDKESDERLAVLLDLFKSAGIEATLSNEISKIIWEKFIFLSCIATATSYYDKTIGQLLQDHKNELLDLLKEVTNIAKAKNITVDQNISEKAMAHYSALPSSATSSMHRDFQSGSSQTELQSITGYVVKQAEKLNLKTPTFQKAYIALQSK